MRESSTDSVSGGRTLGLVREEGVDLAGRTVVGDNVEALVVHVEDEVLALCERMDFSAISRQVVDIQNSP
jgi:hypothetical protein